MAKCRIQKNEEYSDDVFSSIIFNLQESVRKREENSVWGLSPSTARIYLGKALEKTPRNAHAVEIDSDSSMRERDTCLTNTKQQLANSRCSPTSNETSEVERSDIPNIEKIPKFFDQMPRNTGANIKKRTISESEKMNTRKTQAIGSKRENGVVSNEFQSWCQKRYKDFEDYKLKDSATNSLAGLSADKSVNRFINNLSQIFADAELRKTNACQNPQSPAKKCLQMESKSIALKAVKKYGCSENEEKNSEVKTTTKATHKKVYCPGAAEKKSLLCIKLTDKEDKSCEFMAELADISRAKRIFPKLSKIMPNVDSDSVEIKFCFDAVKVIFGYLFNQRYKFDGTSSSLISVEVLAAAQSWEMDTFFMKFQRDFLEKAFTSSNVTKIFCHASQYGLKEICEACTTLQPSLIYLDYPTDGEKSCFLTISTFIEPLECCIPFNPVEKNLTSTFERHIKNQIFFKAIAGCYTITGFQLQLNDDYIQKMSNNKIRLKIDYNIKNLNDNRVLSNQRVEKPLRPVNIVYFRKALVVSAGQIGVINVEMDIKPYLCSTLNESEMKIRKSVGEFCLSMQSDFSLKASNKKVFIIGKLFYHEKGSR